MKQPRQVWSQGRNGLCSRNCAESALIRTKDQSQAVASTKITSLWRHGEVVVGCVCLHLGKGLCVDLIGKGKPPSISQEIRTYYLEVL